MFIVIGPANSTEPSLPTCGVKFDAPFLVSARVTETLSNSANSLALPPEAIANSILDVELVAVKINDCLFPTDKLPPRAYNTALSESLKTSTLISAAVLSVTKSK